MDKCVDCVFKSLLLTVCVITLPYVGDAQTEGDTGYDYMDAYEDDPDLYDPLGRDPTFDVALVNVTVVAGHTAVLPCSIEDLGKKKVTWVDPGLVPLTLDKERVVDDIRFNVLRTQHREWNLVINNIRREDEGQYKCTINTQPPKAKIVTLYIKEAPQIIDELSSQDVTVAEGATVILNCNVTGVPMPEVTWFRRPANGKEEDRESKNRCKMTTSGVGNTGNVIIIANVTRYCDDVYECVADNGVLAAVSRTMEVRVEFAPEIQLRTPIIRQEPHSGTILECLVTANPLRTYYWEKDGKTIVAQGGKYRLDAYDEYDKTVTLSLEIESIDPDRDYGEYKCKASNKHGQDEETMKLLKLKKAKHISSTTRSTTPDKTSPIEPPTYTIHTDPGDRNTPNLNGQATDNGKFPNPGSLSSKASSCSSCIEKVVLKVVLNILIITVTFGVFT